VAVIIPRSNLWRRYIPLYDVHTVWINVRFKENVVDNVLNSHLNFYCDPDKDGGAVGVVLNFYCDPDEDGGTVGGVLK